MALTTLTAAPSFDAVRAPNNGTKVVAVSASDPPPNDEGPIRPSLQALVNRDEFNRVESAAIEAGQRTFFGVVIDGLGGLPASPTNGTLTTTGDVTVGANLGVSGAITVASSATIGRTVSGTTAPTVFTSSGELARAMVPVGWARVTGASGALKRGAGIYTCARTATGVYSIVFHALLNDPVNFGTLVTTELIGGIPIVSPQAAVGGRPAVQVTIQAAGANTDGNFTIAIFGE